MKLGTSGAPVPLSVVSLLLQLLPRSFCRRKFFFQFLPECSDARRPLPDVGLRDFGRAAPTEGLPNALALA